MSIHYLIRCLIREAYGDMEFGTGTKTSEAHQLIAYGENDSESYNYAIKVKNDKRLMFNFLKKRYEKEVGPLFKNGADEETVMYDFMAHYKNLNSFLKTDNARTIARLAFGDLLDDEVEAIREVNGGAIVKVSDDFFSKAIEIATQRGCRVQPTILGFMETQDEVGKKFMWVGKHK